MKEYTLLAIGSGLVVIVLDVFILRTKILGTKVFWMFLCVMYGFKTVVNGYLTWRPIVMYGDEFYLGVRLFTIPVEDYLYGFSLITLSVVLWEYWRIKQRVE
ncbi:MAG: lycopene cyclase domain-containing protein [Bacteroidetes bacterium]|nr:lycopene cyclase domain-containing protein [Bacteroidota bacterium]MCW5894450.1 lycopene cyclase domain-containing protein [Bacteroidota bacterium]